MHSLVMEQDGDVWCRFQLSGPHQHRFSRFLTVYVRPHSLRRYVWSTKYWYVHYTQLKQVAAEAKRYFQVDWSTLPDAWQKIAIGGDPNVRIEAEIVSEPISPYRILYVNEDAPIAVIRAAYKALASTIHPDVNHAPNAAEQMASINLAYKQILKYRNY